MQPYIPSDWYWIVAGDITSVWSSALGNWATTYDPEKTTDIPSVAELDVVLRPLGLKSPIVTAEDVCVERDRRLALGFSYDFGDARGVHLIETTRIDMKGWSEVTALAHARIALGITTTISIVTGTGEVSVTPLEWMQIVLTAGEIREPIWAKSFILQALNPIPVNYTDEIYWT